MATEKLCEQCCEDELFTEVVEDEEAEMEFDDAEEEIDATDELETPITVGTIARLIALLVVLVNMILEMCGKTPLNLDESTIYELCSIIATVVVAFVSFWKNNSFTKQARKADLIKNGVVQE